MFKFVLRKLLLLLLTLPILHAVGYNYALLYPAVRTGGPRRPTPPIYAPYGEYLLNALQTGEWGNVANVPVWQLVAEPFRNSLILVVSALVITIVGGILLGVFSISRHTKRISLAGLLLTTAGASLPGFLLGGVVISILIYQILYNGWSRSPIPISGFGLGMHLVLPLLVLAVRPTLHMARVTSGLIEHELQQDYIRTAQSKGLRWTRVYGRHAFRNVVAPVAIVAGQSMRFIVAGLLIAEMMFLWPGIGRFFVFAVAANENLAGQWQFYANPYLVAALAVLMGLMLLTADLLTSVVAYQADPRLREQG